MALDGLMVEIMADGTISTAMAMVMAAALRTITAPHDRATGTWSR